MISSNQFLWMVGIVLFVAIIYLRLFGIWASYYKKYQQRKLQEEIKKGGKAK